MDLVARIQAGDVEAFEALYRQHSARIYTLASRMAGSAEDGEDLTSLAVFEDFLRHKLTKIEGVSQVTSSFALRPIVYRTALPVITELGR